MDKEQYCVVRNSDCGDFRFGKWHETLEEAKAEAERLARKERLKFLVLKLVGCAEVQEIPVKWTSL